MSRARLTIAQAQAEARALGMTLRRTEAGDFRVNFKGAEEAGAYYTDDLADAVATAQAMHRRGQDRAPGGQPPERPE